MTLAVTSTIRASAVFLLRTSKMRKQAILVPALLALAACQSGEPTEASENGASSVAPTETTHLDGDGEVLAVAASGWSMVPAADLLAEETARLDIGRTARAGLGRTLMQTVVAASAEGAPNAVRVCNDSAPRLAAEASAPGVRLGRTSHRLRNPDNAAPAWAAAHVEGGESTPAVFRGPEGQLAELAPIATAPACLACHGDAAAFPPELQATLTALYPEDRATGFREGELRGWFWLVVD